MRSTRSLLTFFCLALLIVPCIGQTPYVATEYFVVPNWRTANGGFFSWDNWRFEDANQVPHVVTWDNLQQVGTGTYGPIFPDGDYRLEAVWLSVFFPGGFQQGHSHFLPTGGNPGARDRSHFNATADQLQGWRVTRADGQPFTLVGLDYLEAPCGLLVGTSFQDYSSVCSWDLHDQTIIRNDPQWRSVALFDIAPPPLPPAGPGQPCQPGLATMDLNHALNANGTLVNDVCGDLAGPFFSSASTTENFNFFFDGEPFQPIVVLGSLTLNPNVASFPPQGQLDIGTRNPNPPFVPTDIFVLADGTVADFFSSLFNTGSSGEVNLSFPILPSMSGISLAFQSVIFNSTPDIVSFTNAVEITIQ